MCIKTGECPVCDRRYGGQRPRHNLYMHLRRANDEAHMKWKLQHMATAFTRAPRISITEDSASTLTICKQLQQMYSEETIKAVAHQLTLVK